MKIIVKTQNVELVLDETNNKGNDNESTIRFSDQNKNIQETIKIMVQEAINLENVILNVNKKQ